MRPLAIVGNGPTRVYAPHDNKDYDVWAMNNHAFLWEKRITTLFEMHPDTLEAPHYQDGYKDWLRTNRDVDVVMHEVHPEIPASVRFPREEIAGRWGGAIWKGDKPIRDFYTSTFPYCLALALHRNYSHIELFGIDLNKEERIEHRDSVFFWLGLLTANGVKIVLPKDSPLMGDTLYPIRPFVPHKRKHP